MIDAGTHNDLMISDSRRWRYSCNSEKLSGDEPKQNCTFPESRTNFNSSSFAQMWGGTILSRMYSANDAAEAAGTVDSA